MDKKLSWLVLVCLFLGIVDGILFWRLSKLKSNSLAPKPKKEIGFVSDLEDFDTILALSQVQ